MSLPHCAKGDATPSRTQGATISQSTARTFRNRTSRATSAKAMIAKATISCPLQMVAVGHRLDVALGQPCESNQTPMAQLASRASGKVTPRADCANICALVVSTPLAWSSLPPPSRRRSRRSARTACRPGGGQELPHRHEFIQRIGDHRRHGQGRNQAQRAPCADGNRPEGSGRQAPEPSTTWCASGPCRP